MLLRFVSALALVAALTPARAQGIRIPHSSIVRPEDKGVRMHTNFEVLLSPAGGLGPQNGMTPDQILGFYGMPLAAADSGAGVIVVVDAFDYPTAVTDFNVFSGQFSLPAQSTTTPVTDSANTVFQIVYATGYKPDNSSDPTDAASWNQEAATDIEWAHAMAPKAKIVLVEAATDGVDDLFVAVDAAAKIANVQEISMSWAGTEFAGETSYDSHLNITGPLLFAAAGDTPAVVNYPASSPYVVAVGGTHVDTTSSGAFDNETAWNPGLASDGKTTIGGSGGPSVYELKPAWQDYVALISQTDSAYRATPDISSDADPNTGVSMYCAGSWYVIGGTSVSAPCMAGMVNASGITFTSTTQFLTTIYENGLKTPYPFRDILSGHNSLYQAETGWDYMTGAGTPQGSASFAPDTTTVTGEDVLNVVANYGSTSAPSSLEPTGDAEVSINDLDFLMLQLGW